MCGVGGHRAGRPLYGHVSRDEIELRHSALLLPPACGSKAKKVALVACMRNITRDPERHDNLAQPWQMPRPKPASQYVSGYLLPLSPSAA